jgi:hypothetical protein
MAGRWRADAVLAAALRAAGERLGLRTGGGELARWADRRADTRRDRLLLRSYRGARRGYSSQLAAVVVLRGTDRLAYARAVATPSRAYLRARGISRTDLARRVGGSLRRVQPGPATADIADVD